NTVSIFFNSGNGTLQPAVSLPVGNGPIALVAADFDLNGFPDIACANYSNNTITILLSNGNGTFMAPVTYGVGTGPEAIAAADLNGDGFPDIATANDGTNDASILLNQGNGTGTFAPAVAYAAGSVPYAVGLADLNGDGKTDLAVGNFAGDNI